MSINNLNYLLQQIYINKDVLSFDEIYYYFNDFLINSVKKYYKNISDKSLYTKNDIIQESWLKIWLFLAEDKIIIKSLNEFKLYIIEVINDVIIELNKTAKEF